MSYQPVPTAVTNEVIQANWWNTYVRDNLAAIIADRPLVVPSVRVFNSANISVLNSAITVLTFNSELLDTDDIHSTVTQTGRLTCKTAGVYAIYALVEFAANAAGSRHCAIRLNGGDSFAAVIKSSVGSSDPTRVSLSTQYPLAVNDYLEVIVYQNSGNALNVVRVADYSPIFGMTYLGRAA